MSDGRPPDPPAATGRRSRGGCATAAMVIFGVVLLLPGFCALAVTGMLKSGDGALIAIWLICMLISVGGVALIIKASG
jgi:hypothetical protein